MTFLWPEHSYEVHLQQQEVLLKEKHSYQQEKNGMPPNFKDSISKQIGTTLLMPGLSIKESSILTSHYEDSNYRQNERNPVFLNRNNLNIFTTTLMTLIYWTALAAGTTLNTVLILPTF